MGVDERAHGGQRHEDLPAYLRAESDGAGRVQLPGTGQRSRGRSEQPAPEVPCPGIHAGAGRRRHGVCMLLPGGGALSTLPVNHP